MEQFAWTALGLLGASLLAMFASFFYVGNKIDALGARLDSRIDSLATQMTGRMDQMNGRMDAVGAQLQSHIETHRTA